MSILRTENLAIGYGKNIIAENLQLQLHSNSLTCLLGPNGAGKSTLMRSLAGMQATLAGEIFLADKVLQQLSNYERARQLSVVLTERPNVGMLNGYALVALGRHPYSDWLGRLSRQDEAVVRWAVQAVGAEDIAERPFLELSDGQKQKLLIARALAQESHVIILDEPTAFLDLPRRVEIMRLLRDLARETGRAILLSTHDLDLALRSADTLWLMDNQADKPADNQDDNQARRAKIHVGAPEDLVLNGVFQQVFAREGIDFDSELGAFRLARASQHSLSLEGTGLPYIWTKRALERNGYTLRQAETGTPHIYVTEGCWQVVDNEKMLEHHSIAAMLEHINAIFKC